MIKTFKALSILLSYPSGEIQVEAPDLLEAMRREHLLPAAQMKQLAASVQKISEDDLYELQANYVLMFDRTRSLSLHLFEHVHGEGRDRGQALVDLLAVYEAHGLQLSAKELPDYLPLFLEFLSTLPEAEAREHLRQPLHIISTLKERFVTRESPYAAVFEALEVIAEAKADVAEVQALLNIPEDDPEDLAALDAIWEEEAVTFGPGAGADAGSSDGCPKADEMLQNMNMNMDLDSGLETKKPDASALVQD